MTGLLRRSRLTRRTRLISRKGILRVSPKRSDPDRGPTVEYLDNLARELVFFRDGYSCLMCGTVSPASFARKKQPGTFTYQKIYWAHVRSSAYHATRWMTDNAMTLCWPCHNFKWHRLDRPDANAAHFDAVAWLEKVRPGTLDRVDAVLAEFKLTRRKPDRVAIALDLEARLKRLRGVA